VPFASNAVVFCWQLTRTNHSCGTGKLTLRVAFFLSFTLLVHVSFVSFPTSRFTRLASHTFTLVPADFGSAVLVVAPVRLFSSCLTVPCRSAFSNRRGCCRGFSWFSPPLRTPFLPLTAPAAHGGACDCATLCILLCTTCTHSISTFFLPFYFSTLAAFHTYFPTFPCPTERRAWTRRAACARTPVVLPFTALHPHLHGRGCRLSLSLLPLSSRFCICPLSLDGRRFVLVRFNAKHSPYRTSPHTCTWFYHYGSFCLQFLWRSPTTRCTARAKAPR